MTCGVRSCRRAITPAQSGRQEGELMKLPAARVGDWSFRCPNPGMMTGIRAWCTAPQTLVEQAGRGPVAKRFLGLRVAEDQR